MKTKTILISLCLFFASASFAHNRPFERFAEKNDVTSMQIAPAMLRIMGIPILNVGGIDIQNLVDNIESIQVISTTSSARAEQMQREFSQFAATHFEELISVVQGGNDISIYADIQRDRVREVILLMKSGNNSFTTILIASDLSMQEIQQIMETVSVDIN